MTRKMIKPDSLFQIFIKTFGDAFGIPNPDEMETQKREIIPEFVLIDSVAIFPDDFDFATLADRILPFLGQKNVIEFKGKNDDLLLAHLCQYSQIELGLLTNHFLTKVREKRKERVSLSQREATAQWQRLKGQGAQHSCCTIILSTTDPVGLRNAFEFEPVDTYEHLSGALYRKTSFDNKLTGNIATYLVVLNRLPIHPTGAPLLLLSTDKKQREFCNWLLETSDDDELTVQTKEEYMLYLVKHNLVQDEEVARKMWYKIKPSVDDAYFYIDLIAETKPEDERRRFFNLLSKRLLNTDSSFEVAQRALQVDSPGEGALKFIQNEGSEMPEEERVDFFQQMSKAVLHTDSPVEVVQTTLQVNSPEEAALKLIQNDEQMERLQELIRQRNLEKQEATSHPA